MRYVAGNVGDSAVTVLLWAHNVLANLWALSIPLSICVTQLMVPNLSIVKPLVGPLRTAPSIGVKSCLKPSLWGEMLIITPELIVTGNTGR